MKPGLIGSGVGFNDVVGVEVDNTYRDVIADGSGRVREQIVAQLEVVVAESVSDEVSCRVVIGRLVEDGHTSLGQILEHLLELDCAISWQGVQVEGLLASHMVADQLNHLYDAQKQ